MDSDYEELEKYNYNTKNKYLHNLGNDYFNDNNYYNALIIYNKLLENIIDNELISILYSNISACYLKLENYHKALDKGIKALNYNNKNSVAWGRVGWASKKLKKHDESLHAFKIANNLNPYNFNYKNEIYYYNTKKINKINFFELFKSSDYILKKISDENFRNKILVNSLNPENLMKDYEFVKLIDHIVYKL
jgi:tetratricopeptide (TPR) repeat protein